jgi:photosystem II stability/assembly factor-like uncharacterized protein
VWTREPLRCARAKTTAGRAPTKGWRTLSRGTPSSLLAISVSASNADDVWIVGTEGTILHTADHGKAFDHCTIASVEALTSVWAASRDDVWILGTEHVFHIENGSTLATLSVALQSHCGTPLNAVFGRAPSDVWIANGALLHTKDGGTTWDRAHSCGESIDDGCAAEIAGAAAELWTDCPFIAAGSGDGGATWSSGSWPPHTEEQMHVAVSADDVWVVGQSTGQIGRSVDHGATWSLESLGDGPFDRLFGSVWSAGRGWAWILADGVWGRHGKLPWIREFPEGIVSALGGRDEKDVWAVGPEGLVLHRP